MRLTGAGYIDYPLFTFRSVTIKNAKPGSFFDAFLVAAARYHDKRPGYLGHAQNRIAVPEQFLQGFIIRLIPSHNDLAGFAAPEMAAILEQFNVPGAMFRIMREEIFQAFGKHGVCQETSAGRRRIIMDAIRFSHLHLHFSAPALKRQQLLPVDLALLFRSGFGKKSGAQRSDDIVCVSGIFCHDVQGLPGLRHGPLPQNFSCKQKISACFLHDFSRCMKHEGVAIDTWVHVFTVTVSWRLEHGKMPVRNVDNKEGHLDMPCRFSCLAGIKKGGFEGYPLHGDVLILNDFHSENAVKAAGK